MPPYAALCYTLKGFHLLHTCIITTVSLLDCAACRTTSLTLSLLGSSALKSVTMSPQSLLATLKLYLPLLMSFACALLPRFLLLCVKNATQHCSQGWSLQACSRNLVAVCCRNQGVPWYTARMWSVELLYFAEIETQGIYWVTYI